MDFFGIADRLILRPSTHTVPARGKTRRMVEFDGGYLEVWVHRTRELLGSEPDVFILKFMGNASRAEWAASHPANSWHDLAAEVWAVNLPGYGGSTGPAGLRRIAPAARTVYNEVRRVARGRPIVVTGNSLGTAPALFLAAAEDFAGLVLRNPPPLRSLILRRHGWWNLWVPALVVASQVPRDLDSVRNAARARVPAVFVSSACDRLVPPAYQRQVIHAYAGAKKVLVLEGAGHGSPMTAEQERAYAELARWLRQQFERHAPRVENLSRDH